MDGKLKKTSEMRKAVVPLFEQMLEKLEKKMVGTHVHLPNELISKSSIVVDLVTVELKKAFDEAIAKIEIPDPKDFPDVQKEKLVDKIEPPVVKVTENKVIFPEVQEIKGKVSVKELTKLVDELDKKLEGMQPLDSVEINNLPTVKFLKKNKKKNAVPVIIENWEHMSAAGGMSGTIGDSGGSKTPTNWEGGPVAVGITAIEMKFSQKTKTVVVQADHDNDGTLYFGKSNVKSDGSSALGRLEPGQSEAIDLDDSSAPVFVVASEASQKVYKRAVV